MNTETQQAFERLREIAHRDEAKAVTVRADDLRAVLAATLHQQAARVDEEAIRDVIVLLRAHAKNKNHHDAVFADKLEAALSAQPAERQGGCIGEARENGVTWFRDNPHAFPVGTRFYTPPPAAPVGVPDVGAYRLWKAIYAASDKAGHPCRVGLAQVIDALESLAAAPSAPQGEGDDRRRKARALARGGRTRKACAEAWRPLAGDEVPRHQTMDHVRRLGWQLDRVEVRH